MVALVDDALDVAGVVDGRKGTGTEQALPALLQVLGAPIVVGPGLHLPEGDIGLALEPEHDGRVEDGQLVPVHVLQAQLRRPTCRAGLGVCKLAAANLLDHLVGEAGCPREAGLR
jgi:hypothetical protein